jgi:hypothetical protein
MNQQDNWPSWIGAVATVLGLGWGFIQWLLSSKFREVEGRQQERHEENLEKFADLSSRLNKLEQSQARTEGMISGRYPRTVK